MASTCNIPARPLDIEDPSNRWLIHPVADALLGPALRLGLAPNTVSFAGLGFGMAAGFAYAHWRAPGMALLGLLLMLCWHVADGLDGKLARASGRASALGRVIDGACDYLVFFCVLIPIALSFENWGQMLALCLTAGAFHAVQAAWYEGEREAWRRRAAGDFAPRERPQTGHFVEKGHNWLEARLGSGLRPIDTALAAQPSLLPEYLAATAPLVRAMSVAGANWRTFGIFIAVAAGSPRLYWLWEIFGVTSCALILGSLTRRREAAVARLGQPVLERP